MTSSVFVLMLYIIGTSGTASVAMHDFNSKAACENAVKVYQDYSGRWGGVWGVCAPKGAAQ